MPRTETGNVPAAFSTLPSPSPLEYRWSVSPADRPSDDFLISWYNAGHAGGQSPSPKAWLERNGWRITEDGSGGVVAEQGKIHLKLVPDGRAFLVVGLHGPAWMPDGGRLLPFDCFAHCSHEGVRQAALEAAKDLYLHGLRDSAFELATSYPNTDAGNMERLIARWHKDIRYSDALGWHIWDGRVWRRQDGKDSVLLMARMRETIRFASWGVQDASDDEETRKFLTRSENTSRLRAALDQARSHGSVLADDREFELRPWTVGFPNGVWKQGKFLPLGREHRITRLMQSEYHQEPGEMRGDVEWRALLDRMVCGDTEKERMLQEVAGAAIGGGAHERILPWLHGPKGTGKSTFIALLQAAMGEAALPLGTDMVSGQQDGERLGVAALGRRLLVLTEMGNERVNTSLAKRLTGGDPLHARFLYSSTNFTVWPTWMVVAASNDAPVADASDAAFWNSRMKVIALDNALDRNGDDHVSLTSSSGMPATLEEARSDPASPLVHGFVRWAMKGAQRLHGSGKGIAWTQAVRDATEAMRRETDPIAEFHSWLMTGDDSECRDTLNSGNYVFQKDIRAAYRRWCEEEGVRHPVSPKRLMVRLEQYGFKRLSRGAQGEKWYVPKEDIVLSLGRKEVPAEATRAQGRARSHKTDWQMDQPPGFGQGGGKDGLFSSGGVADDSEF